MRKTLPIDKMLRWVLCEELPKGQPVALSAWDVVMRHGRLGVRVDVSHGGSGLGLVPGDPHPDALIVAAELRKLPRDYRLGRDRVARLLGDAAALDDGACDNFGDAPFNLAALALNAAVLRAPEWDVGAIEPSPVCYRDRHDLPIVYGDVDGELRPIQSRGGSKGNYDLSLAPRCRVDWGVALIAEARAEYAAWHDGLQMLVRAIQARTDLREIAADAPALPAEPWRVPAQPEPVSLPIVMGGAPVSREILPLVPKRYAPRRPLKSSMEELSESRNRARARERIQVAK